MSLELARKVNAKRPDLLQRNTADTCYQFTLLLIEELRAAGFKAYSMCKTAGEGQYTPFMFQPRIVKGLDGKDYTCTGVSHDAIWCDGLQFDTVGGGNDSLEPIGIPGSPQWNPIPQQYWRAGNPPLVDGGFVITPQPSAHKPYPGDPVFDAVGVSLFADYAEAGQLPNPQMGRWFGRTIFDYLEGIEPSLDASIKKHRNEWRPILGLGPK